MNLLFITDPLDSFNLDKDSSLAMMREAVRRGHVVWACGTSELHWQSGQMVSASMQRLRLKDNTNDWYVVEETIHQALCQMDAVLMRKDPPFDNEYFMPRICSAKPSVKVPRFLTIPARCVSTPKNWR